ncbi:Lrp/AsnC family transcriptional regulator [Mycobacterium sp. shizuoka-1]|uniref:Lrp/AsnC family transcriptional regulator n=1 Tax=Mycobacterium sp. shizuoka-1 TaxID=2039281 RepID=UPI001304282E|nr:Lrp/AsnC family transcriptional regulator [Mycobacterium sp. shizuoka-1]
MTALLTRAERQDGDVAREPEAIAQESDPSTAPHHERATEISDLDRALINRLRIDGRESNRSLAQRLGVNEVTVAARLRRMEDAGIMRVVAVTDIRLFGHREFNFALLRVRGRSVQDVATKLAALPETIGVTVTSGRFDIVLPVVCRDRAHTAEMFGTVLTAIDGVEGVHGTLALDVLKYDSNWASFHNPGTTPQAQPSDTVDGVDLEIIQLLQKNARRSNRSIAAELGFSEGTIRGRIKRMLNERVFRIQAVTNLLAFGRYAYAFVLITAEPGTVESIAAILAARDDISQITHVLDDFALILVMTARDHSSIMAAVNEEITFIPGVLRTETLHMSQSLKHTYEWTWIV